MQRFTPETTVIKDLTLVKRERALPPHALADAAQAVPNEPVDAVTTVLTGSVLGDYRILDVVKTLRLKHPTPEHLENIITAKVGQRVQLGQELARVGRGRRARVLLSPVQGVVVAVGDGRMVLQKMREVIEVKARLPGRVEAVSSHAVTVSGKGALIQCAWGNGRFAFCAFKHLPPEGFAELARVDPRISEYRNVVIISRAPLTAGDLRIAQQQELAGVVAPCMSADLRELAMRHTFPVILTEGFGGRRPTEQIYALLARHTGLQAVFDAAQPAPWSADRPEIIIPLPAESALIAPPEVDQPLAVGQPVRVTRAPWDGQIGIVQELPAAPQAILNGLRVACAGVRLEDGARVWVPLADLEGLG